MIGKRNVPVCRGHELANALYTTGAFIGCVDKAKSEQITKGEKMTEA